MSAEKAILLGSESYGLSVRKDRVIGKNPMTSDPKRIAFSETAGREVPYNPCNLRQKPCKESLWESVFPSQYLAGMLLGFYLFRLEHLLYDALFVDDEGGAQGAHILASVH